MQSMFEGCSGLQKISLGNKFTFQSNSDIQDQPSSFALEWKSTSTPKYFSNSSDFMNSYNGATDSGTYVRATLYKISYDYGIGSVPATGNPTTYAEGTGLASFNDEIPPTGYSFEGWYTEPTFTNKITSISSTQKGAITLYAKHLKIVTLNLNTNNSTNGSVTVVTINGITVNTTGVITLKENDVVEISAAATGHFAFNNWEGTGVNLSSSQKISSTVSYDLKEIKSHSVDAGATVPVESAPYVGGHTFASWVIEGTNTKWNPNTNMPHSDIKLVATYDKNVASDTSKTNKATKSPKTGDTSNITLPITLLSFAIVSLITLFVWLKKKKKTQE